jgi:gluconate 5-dehydrogenase
MSRTLPEWLDLTGRVAIVTGGGTHLGRAMSKALGELGSSVHIVGRRREVLEKTAADLRDDGIDAHFHPADAADEAAMSEVVDEVMRKEGRLDTMICNAGGKTGREAAPHIEISDFEATVRQNVTTTLVCAQLGAIAMIPRRSGSIITVGSTHGSLGSDPHIYGPQFQRSVQSYHASKGAIINLTRALATEFAEYGIRVNCISPGQVPQSLFDEVTLKGMRRATPIGRLGRPEDLYGAVALLASEAGSWITGHNLVVDGGWSAW